MTLTIQPSAYQLETETLLQCSALQKNLETQSSSILTTLHCEVCDIIFFCDGRLEYLEKLAAAFGNYVGTKKAALSPPPSADSQLEHKVPYQGVLFPSLRLSLDSANTSIHIEGDNPIQSMQTRSLFRLLF